MITFSSLKKNTHPASASSKVAGFTIVETLVAVAILMIAITGPLVSSTRALYTTLLARDQMTAVFLAQEGLEVVKNIRDRNILLGGADNWLGDGALSAGDIGNCFPVCSVDALTGTLANTTLAGGQLYVNGNGEFTTSGGTPTNFRRLVYVSDIFGFGNQQNVEVTVYWQQGAITNQFVLKGAIFKQLR